MKLKHIVFIIALIIIADQALKIWIKTNYMPGESTEIFPWFNIHFIENPGMAWGWKFGNETGKVILTLFRLAAVIFGTWYLGRIVKQHYHKGFIICAALIYAGALGNLIDSMFYGMVFDKGLVFDAVKSEYQNYTESIRPAALTLDGGYSSFLHGCVVDMLYFPIFDGKFPTWFPFWGGEDFTFFSPIFNIADASISAGVITLLLFQKRFFKRKKVEENYAAIETSADISDKVQVQ